MQWISNGTSGSGRGVTCPGSGRRIIARWLVVLGLVLCLAHTPVDRCCASQVHYSIEKRRAEAIARLGPIVSEVMIVGNHSFGRKKLEMFMRIRPSGFFHRYHFDPAVLERDLENIRRYYAAEGFLEAGASVERVVLSPDSTTVRIVIGIDEGRRWTITDVSFEGNSVLSDGELHRHLAVREGAALVATSLQSDRKAVLNEYAKRSFLDARVAQDVVRDDEECTAKVRYRIVEREPSVVGSIVVVGREKTRLSVIERELAIAPGEPFDPGKIGKTQANLYRTGLFHSAWVEPAPADTGREVRGLIVSLSERPSGTFDLGVGYAAIDGARATTKLGDRNFRGRGTRVGLKAGYGRFVREVELSVTEPWLAGTRLALGAVGGYTWRDEEFYTGETVSGSLFLSRALGRALRIEGGYEFKRAVILEAVEGSDFGENYTSDLSFAATFDSRDNVLSTESGRLARGEIDFASSRLGGTNDFVRCSLEWRGFANLPHGRVGGLAVRVGWIKPQGDGSEVPVDERYFAGGEGSVRGYERNSLCPLDERGEAKGGRALVEIRAEARFPVHSKLRGVIFVDAGRAFTDFPGMRMSDLAVGAGAGLRLGTPVGVVRLDVASPVSEGGALKYYLSVGQAF